MTKLYLVRHGETVDNKAQIMQGQTPGKLNMKGIEQAEEVARKMEEIRKAMERMDLERLKLLLVTALEWAKK